jgi:hypothetical protein
MDDIQRARVALWVEDLRTTSVRQGQGWLRKGGAWCCLGRACEVYRRYGNMGAWDGSLFVDQNRDSSIGDLPFGVARWFGFNFANPFLINELGERMGATLLNDVEGYTFPDIADAIERTYLNPEK